MDKVWFKLRQLDYPPPTPESMGTATETGPLCLGHFVPDLSQIDFPINRNQIEPFPRSMPVYTTTAYSFKWEDSQASEDGGVLGGGAPVLAVMPVTAKADMKAIFRASVSTYEAYERLDTYLVQVNRSYVADCLENDSIAQHKKNSAVLGKWSMFIITGLKVARAGSRSKSSSRKVEYGLGLEAELPAIASFQIEPTHARECELKLQAEKHSDFVWAIRLAKVHKGVLAKDWSIDPYMKKATFNDAEDRVDLEMALSSEGQKSFCIAEDSDLDELFVILDDGKEPNVSK